MVIYGPHEASDTHYEPMSKLDLNGCVNDITTMRCDKSNQRSLVIKIKYPRLHRMPLGQFGVRVSVVVLLSGQSAIGIYRNLTI